MLNILVFISHHNTIFISSGVHSTLNFAVLVVSSLGRGSESMTDLNSVWTANGAAFWPLTINFSLLTSTWFFHLCILLLPLHNKVHQQKNSGLAIWHIIFIPFLVLIKFIPDWVVGVIWIPRFLNKELTRITYKTQQRYQLSLTS